MKPAIESLDTIGRLAGVNADQILGPLREQQVRTAWLSGSLIEGLGNPSSDVDIFAVVPKLTDSMPATKKGQDHFVQVYFSNSRRIDFEYWSTEAIALLHDKLQNAPIGDGTKNILDYFPEHEVEFIHRLHIGAPILGEADFSCLQRTFDRSRLIAYLIENKRIYVDDAFDDTVGLMREGHLLSAAYRARCTLDFSADILLYAYDISNHKEKHRYRLLLRLLTPHPEIRPLFQTYLQLTAQLPNEFLSLQRHITDCLNFSERLVHCAMKRYQENIGA